MSIDKLNKMQFGFSGENGEFISFDEMAKELPQKYPSIGEYDLPTSKERTIIKGMDRFFDFFQIVYVDEDQSEKQSFPNDMGWYWVTYFSNTDAALSYIGPFSDEHRALDHACSHALPLNDPRRQKYKYGYIGSGVEMCWTIPRMRQNG
jgi:hypothetical protein